jgi:hypothetical protein
MDVSSRTLNSIHLDTTGTVSERTELNARDSFSILNELGFGNRVDREVTGNGEDDDWYSYTVDSITGNIFYIDVYDDEGDDRYRVTWEKII